MTYRIVIVDDEEDIREGLHDLVDWSGLGYTVVARLEDGREAISYIQSYPVDVILTDIKMTFVSGLELAKYVFDRQLPIKMVLISGYKEFEFAQQALHYRVAHYLLKPTKLGDIHRVFRELSAALDQDKAEKERSLGIQSRNEEMLSLLRRQLFSDMIGGFLPDLEELRRRLPWTGLSLDPDNSSACVYTIRIPADGQNPDAAADAEGSRIFRFLQSQYREELDFVLHVPLRNEADGVRMIAIDLGAGRENIDPFAERVVAHFDTIKGRIMAVLGLEAELKHRQSYGRLTDLAVSARRAAEPPSTRFGRVSPLAEHPEPGSYDPLVIQKAKSYIQEKYNEDLSLDDVAEHVYLSPVYFSRLFKKQTGRNFTEYVTEIRMLRAMEYLRQPQYKVYEIGSIIGFKSVKYFFKLFKQYAGCTPTEYRNTLPREGRR
ncbi:MAG: hypothetical protein K0Q94_437 [Paenibacillus sp.]|nr:hypothetical protein [Paenibacillus sp.]